MSLRDHNSSIAFSLLAQSSARGSLGALGLNRIDINSKMEIGAPYVFHFSNSSWFTISPNTIGAVIATDSNFGTPVVSPEPGGFQVRFIYSGRGSAVGDAGIEMQNVIQSHSFNGAGLFDTLYFVAAEGGPADDSPSGVNPTSPPGTSDGSGDSGSGVGNFLTGLGVGGTLATIAVVVWALRN